MTSKDLAWRGKPQKLEKFEKKKEGHRDFPFTLIELKVEPQRSPPVWTDERLDRLEAWVAELTRRTEERFVRNETVVQNLFADLQMNLKSFLQQRDQSVVIISNELLVTQRYLQELAIHVSAQTPNVHLIMHLIESLKASVVHPQRFEGSLQQGFLDLKGYVETHLPSIVSSQNQAISTLQDDTDELAQKIRLLNLCVDQVVTSDGSTWETTLGLHQATEQLKEELGGLSTQVDYLVGAEEVTWGTALDLGEAVEKLQDDIEELKRGPSGQMGEMNDLDRKLMNTLSQEISQLKKDFNRLALKKTDEKMKRELAEVIREGVKAMNLLQSSLFRISMLEDQLRRVDHEYLTMKREIASLTEKVERQAGRVDFNLVDELRALFPTSVISTLKSRMVEGWETIRTNGPI